MQAGGKKKVFAGGDTIHLTFSNFEDVLDLIGETERLQDAIQIGEKCRVLECSH